MLTQLPQGKIDSKESVDMRGKRITTFIIYEADKILKSMNEIEILEIATDSFEGIESDIKAWCRMVGHKLIQVEQGEDYQRYYIQKGMSEKIIKKQLAVVISNPGLEELLSPLGFSLAAALQGIEVYIYFQGPAVEVLQEGFKESLGGISSIFSGFARDGLNEIGHIPPQEKLKQLKELGAHLFICAPSMEHFGVKKSELIFDDVIVAEYFTFMEQMSNADIHIFLQ
jgi:predicted peroxiredoxin/TusA-related sulfurtransferase